MSPACNITPFTRTRNGTRSPHHVTLQEFPIPSSADRAYGQLLENDVKAFNKFDRQTLKDDAATIHLLKDAPPQSVELNGAFSVPTHLSKIGTIETNFTVNGVTKSWILDTGANFSVLTETAAREMKLKLSEGKAQTQGSSGAENPLHIAIVPEMKIGTAVVHNVVVLVIADSGLRIPLPTGTHQIDAILGFPVLSALKEITFTSNALSVAPGKDDSGARIYMQALDPLVECRVAGHDMLLLFDSGASSTTLTLRYYNEFRSEFAGLSPTRRRVAGAGGTKEVSSYNLENAKVEISDQTAVLKAIPVATQSVGSDFDLLYGDIGRDLTSQFKSFTLDFEHMRFRLSKQ